MPIPLDEYEFGLICPSCGAPAAVLVALKRLRPQDAAKPEPERRPTEAERCKEVLEDELRKQTLPRELFIRLLRAVAEHKGIPRVQGSLLGWVEKNEPEIVHAVALNAGYPWGAGNEGDE